VIFEHADITLPECNRKNIDGRRMYLTETGEAYPSITTVLSRMSRDGIKAWRERVGAEVANKISTQASRRGTAVHKLAEEYLSNNSNWTKGAMPTNIETFNTIKPILERNINLVYGLEVNLWSDYLGVAGQCDCVCQWQGKNTIVDFKTARKAKKEEHIQNYFMQGCAYAIMFEERTGIAVPYIAIVIAVDGDDPQVFHVKRDDYVEGLREQIKLYKTELSLDQVV
jgi:hypothetical protein